MLVQTVSKIFINIVVGCVCTSFSGKQTKSCIVLVTMNNVCVFYRIMSAQYDVIYLKRC